MKKPNNTDKNFLNYSRLKMCRGCGKQRGTYKKQGRTFGECATIMVEYTGVLPFACFGAITGERYKWSSVKPVLTIDERDLASVQAQAERKIKIVGEIDGVLPPEKYPENWTATNASERVKTWLAQKAGE